MFYLFQVFVYNFLMENWPRQAVWGFHLDVRKPLLQSSIFTNVCYEKFNLARYLDYIKKRSDVNVLSVFLDSACQELDLDHHCYKFDPHCPPNIHIQTRENFATVNLLSGSLGILLPVISFMVLLCILKLLKCERSNDGKLNNIHI